MEHLSLEALARLVDEPAEPAEAAHLEVCAECRAELDALREQTSELAHLPDLEPPPDIWPAIEACLREEGLLRAPRRASGSVWLRLAAALALFLAGGVVGFAVRGAAQDEPFDAESITTRIATAADAEEVARLLEETRAAYFAALNRYAEFSEPVGTGDLITRAVALEGILFTTRAALAQAPADPVINGYHLSALAQHESTLRQIAFDPAEPWY
ncbi:MAG: hypothetical protein DIU52_006245 [bacterium]|jgi:hypothetical protein|nr:MAG: hypothetical protein DIU52_05675 [bacterium]